MLVRRVDRVTSLAWSPVIAFREAIEARLADRTRDVGAAFRWLPDEGLVRLVLDDQTSAYVWACAVATVDPMMYPHLIAIGGADGRRGLTPAMYAALTGIDEQVAIELAYWLAGEPLIVRLGLLHAAASGLAPIATPYRATPRLIGHLLGEAQLDQAVARCGGLIPLVDEPRHDDAQRTAIEALRRALAADRLVIVEGPRGVGRRSAIAGCAAQLGRSAVAIDGARVDFAELDRTIRAVCGDAILRGAIPVIADLDRVIVRDDQRDHVAPMLARILDDVPGPCAVTTTRPGFELPCSRAIARVALQIADVPTRLALWHEALADRAPELPALREVALRHRLGAGQIAIAARAAIAVDPDTAAPVPIADVIGGIRHALADRFGALAERLTVDDDWSAIVLSRETLDQLHALVARVQHAWTVFEDWGFPRQTARGGGVAALFSGPPGTGKTMVAGLIARELGRDLYRIDLSQIVSKWVGETEKQLGQVFDAAESGNALLLFDEADSLFARRTEVKSSSDRYANLEVNYLLQRIETFGGMTILTTNLDTSIDPALRRRLASHVVFWPPEHDERAALWTKFLATRAPVAGRIDVDELATEYPDMTGANIRNAALAAAFLAARDGGPITRDRVHRAARAEYRAMGRVLAGGRK